MVLKNFVCLFVHCDIMIVLGDNLSIFEYIWRCGPKFGFNGSPELIIWINLPKMTFTVTIFHTDLLSEDDDGSDHFLDEKWIFDEFTVTY